MQLLWEIVIYFDPLMVGRADNLKPFTQELLNKRPELFLCEDPEEKHPMLAWEGMEDDAKCLAESLYQLVLAIGQRALQETSELFRLIPSLQQAARDEFLTTNLFTRLNDTEVRVTPGHIGTTPFEHVMQVIESLIAAHKMDIEQLLVIFFTAEFHDSGKGLSSGVEGIDALMKGYGSLGENGVWKSALHSHPDHAIISEMMLRALLETDAFARFVAQLDENKVFPKRRWEDVLQLIRHHHGFEKNLTTEAAQVGFSFEQVVLLFYFKFADACSTKAYRKDWPKAREVFRQWLDGFDFDSEEVSDHSRELAQTALELDLALLEGGDAGNTDI